MKKNIVLALATLSLTAPQAFAGAVEKVFNNYADGTVLVGDDLLSGQDCELRFEDYSDGRTMGLYTQGKGSKWPEKVIPGTYLKDYKHTWFKNYISSNKKHVINLLDVLGSALGNSSSEYEYTVDIYFDSSFKVVRATYRDDLHKMLVSDCKF